MTEAPADLCLLSIAELAPLIRGRAVSPVEIAKAVLARITAVDDRVRAFCTLEPEKVLAQARAAEQRVLDDDAVGPLFGVPIAVKDLIFTKDLRTVGGSTAYRDFQPDEDDVVVERLRNAGAVILGKTNVPEFGFGAGLTTNPVFGTTHNPWDLERTPGSSSGGSAAAVAAGMGPGALGSDGGGSIRSPASYCGLYGIKPSFGRVPLYPGCRDTRYPGFSGWESLEHLGPLARTVTDAALMLDVIVGPDRRDRLSVPRPEATFADLDGPGGSTDLRGLRIAWSLDFGGYARVDADVRAVLESAIRVFEALGATLEEAAPFAADPGADFAALMALDADMAGLRTMVAQYPDAVNDRTLAMLRREPTFAEISDAASARRRLYNDVWRFFDRYDLLLTPTTPTTAYPIADVAPKEIGGVPVLPGTPTNWFTSPWNMAGNPAASIPAGWTEGGLPVGLQIVGGHLDDPLVLRASRAFERAAPWADRRPPI